MPAGRHTDYNPAYCAVIIEAGKEGKSKAEWAVACGCSKQTLYTWCESNPQFLDAFKMAETYSLAFYERQGRENLGNPRYNQGLYGKIMAARFPDDGYRETRNLNHSGGMNITVATGVPDAGQS